MMSRLITGKAENKTNGCSESMNGGVIDRETKSSEWVNDGQIDGSIVW
jgi:hypothetical protein